MANELSHEQRAVEYLGQWYAAPRTEDILHLSSEFRAVEQKALERAAQVAKDVRQAFPYAGGELLAQRIRELLPDKKGEGEK